MKLLYISAYAPYDGILHAGGKTHNYYLKELAKKFEIKLITYVQDFEANKMDLDRYGIDHKYIFYPNTIFGKVKNKWSRINPLNRYGGFIPCFFEINHEHLFTICSFCVIIEPEKRIYVYKYMNSIACSHLLITDTVHDKGVKNEYIQKRQPERKRTKDPLFHEKGDQTKGLSPDSA